MKKTNKDTHRLYADPQSEAVMSAILPKILGALGLALNAGGLAVGSEAVNLAIGRGKARLVFLAQDISDNTREKLLGKIHAASFNENAAIRYIFLPCNMDTLAAHLGKSGLVSAAALIRPGFEKIIFKSMEKASCAHNITEVQE